MPYSPLSQQISDQLGIQLSSPEQPFCPPWPGAERVKMWIKRDDLIHPVISGNKWRKLSGIFSQWSSLPKGIISFGGGYSNHLHALGYLCHQLNLPFVAVVRGNYHNNKTPMLNDLHSWGATVHYVNRITYRQRTDPGYLSTLSTRWPGYQIIAEGGSEPAALAGTQSIISESCRTYDYVVCPVASGATLAGIAASVKPPAMALGVAVLKGEGYLEELVSSLMPAPYDNWRIEHAFHGGGYAKVSEQLYQFCQHTTDELQVPVEPVYSGKLLFGIKEMLKQEVFSTNSNVLILHTGGLQGARK